MFRHNTRAARIGSAGRRGAFMVLAFASLIVMLAFVAFSIDTGHIALNKTIMQNGVDAAALAAAMEITNAVENAPPEASDPTAFAREQAKTVAANTAELNGVYVDPAVDVEFGLRWYNPATERFEIQWGVEPANAVKVRARRDKDDINEPDGKLPMLFAGVLGEDSVAMGAEAIAYIESRDIAVVLDFSGSMAYDSMFRSDSINRLGANAIRSNLESMSMEMAMADGSLGTLDHIDPDNSASARNGVAKWLVVHGNPPSGDDPHIDVTFMYNQVQVSSDMPFKEVELKFGGNWQSFNGLNTSSGTYSGTGGYWGDEIDEVRVTVDTGESEVVQSGQLDGRGSPNATVTVNHDNNSVHVTLDSNSLDRVRIYYTDGSRDTWSNQSGRNRTYNADSNKTIQDVRVKSGNGDERRFEDFDEASEYVETFEDSNSNVKKYFALNGTSWPFDRGDWDSYINYVRGDSDINRGGQREMYGGSTLVHYLLVNYPSHDDTPELARTSHYPFHAVRKGNELFVDFLSNLGFGDHVGLVSYDQYRRQEMTLDENDVTIDISADPLDSNYEAIKTILEYKQANNYYAYTNIGGGIRESRQQITDHGRSGARPTILLMTDGNANTYDNQAGLNSLQYGFYNDGFYQMAGDFDWSIFNDLDGTSVYPFYINNDGSSAARARIYALSQAWEAVKEGTTVHTLAVGSGADTDLMKAIAFLGDGEFIEVQGVLTVENLLEEVEAGFYRIAALVPPARLADPAESAAP